VPESKIQKLLADFASEMSVHSYPLPSWLKSSHGLEISRLPAPQVILECLRAIEASPKSAATGAFAMDWYLSPVIQGAARRSGEWDHESAAEVLSQLHQMADRLEEDIITVKIPYPAHLVVSSIDRSSLDKSALADLATRLIDRYRNLALERFKLETELLARHAKSFPDATLLDVDLAVEEIRIGDYPEQSFDANGKKLIGTLRSWLSGPDAWENDDWGVQAIPLLAAPEGGRAFELKLLRLYPKHSGRFEWATTAPRPGFGSFVGPNNLRRLMEAVANLTPPLDDEEALGIRDVMISAWETLEDAGKRSGKLGTQCLKALACRKDLLREVFPLVNGAQIRKQLEAVIAAP
jgi:hypothetical protein